MDGSNWASGRWRVQAGKEDEFIERWAAWLTTTSRAVITSVSKWADTASLQACKASPGFQEGMGSTRALCNEFMGGDFGLASAIDPG